MGVSFGDFSKAPDAISPSKHLDKVSSRHLDMYKTAGEGSGSNSKWGTSGWGEILNFRAHSLVFYQLLDRRVEHKLSKSANSVVLGDPVDSFEGRGETLWPYGGVLLQQSSG